MEAEAWFLAEATHFERIDPKITAPAIVASCGFNPTTDDLERRPNPAKDLSRCYAIAGRTYQKHLAQDTVNSLDYAVIHLEAVGRFRHLRRLADTPTAFFRRI